MAQVLGTEKDALIASIVSEERIYVVVYADDYSWEFIQAKNEKLLATHLAEQRVLRPIKCILTRTQMIIAKERHERVENLINEHLFRGKG